MAVRYLESVTNGKHRRLVKYDVSTLDARFAKKVTGAGNDFPRLISVFAYGSIYRKKVEKG